MKKITHIVILNLLFLGTIHAQLTEQEPVLVKRIDAPITIDGKIDEAAWFEGQPAENFWLYFPTDSMKATVKTEIYMTFDDKNLYVAAKCYSIGDDYTVPNLRRDYRAGNNDNITLLFDPFNDRTNAFVFGMNALGVRREALISNGGQERNDFLTSWDNKWFGEAAIYDGYWVAEFAIPFKTLRYNEGVKTWRFNSYRFDLQSNETSTWMKIPQNQIVMNLAFMGEMQWEEAPPKPGANISLIPYAISNINHNIDEGDVPEANFNIGGDAKVAVTSGINLDLTVNPDFSQVEVDELVTNLTRFELSLPERRQFFLENSDLFGSFGAPNINPFFSRRIGIAYDTTTQQNVQNPIYYGARLSGKIDNNWRVGLLNMQAAANEKNGLPSYNYSVAAIQRKLFSRSNIGAIFVNKQTFEELDEESSFSPYNRVVGLDYNLATSDNSWTGKAFYHRVLTPEKEEEQFSHAVALFHTKRAYEFTMIHERVGENFDAEVGFVPRKDFNRVISGAQLNYYPTEGLVVRHGPSIEATFLFNPEFGRTDHAIEASWDFSLKTNARMGAEINNRYTYLFNTFNPTRVDTSVTKVRLLEEGAYNFTSFRAFFSSDRRKDFSYFISPTAGQFFNGYRYGLRGGLNLNIQPRARIELDYNINYIQLPEGYDQALLLQIGPRVDLTFTKNLFLTTFLQYNNQTDNVNLNARFQWRFKPVSDFFLVYTDNYYSTDFRTRNRAIVAKLTYWLNV
ncbi:MAG: DUF5916 domain-containing protein [Bacteroidota bacterium]